MTSEAVDTLTSTTQAILQSNILQHTYSIPSPNPTSECGIYDETDAKLGPGQLSVSFAVVGSDTVDFWVLNSQQWTTWQSITNCQEAESYPGLTSIVGVNSWNTTVTVPATDLYYFVFVNKNNEGVTISLSVNEMSSAQTTQELFLTSYTTQSSTWQTSALVTYQQLAGLGTSFFLGIAFLLGASVGLILAYRNRRHEGEVSGVTVEIPSAEAGSAQLAGARARGGSRLVKIICPHCRSEIAADGMFCSVCGNKIEPEE